MKQVTPQMLWKPEKEMMESSNLSQYMNWLKQNRGLSFDTYDQLWKWSTDHIEDFWQSIWDYFDVISDGTHQSVLTGSQMPYYKWFEGRSLNYAEHVFRNSTQDYPALLYKSEDSPIQELSWKELETNTANLQAKLIALGIEEGDRIAAYLPCIPEATIGFLATNSLGAIWSSCSPDFGTQSIIDRFAQIEPKVLIATDSYQYGGKQFNKKNVVEEVVKAIPSIHTVILVTTSKNNVLSIPQPVIQFNDIVDGNSTSKLTFKRIPFSSPIWILYSSGTTGLPKPITHSQGGILLEQLKFLAFHKNQKPGERSFWFTTTGWMMWNHLMGSFLCGATVVLYDGSPAYPNLNVLWKLAQDSGMNQFGTSAGFIMACLKAGINPKDEFDLSNLKFVGSTGSTLPPEGFNWIYQYVKKDVWLASVSGGT
ncbi:MAG: AMP-binding protein, partial [Flammeovirgaceae bacterium]|nr:AMP-binding protein [Flammeovirgaceae bacterium]